VVQKPCGEREREALLSRAVSLAREYFVERGGNCSESTLWGVLTALDLPLTDSLRRAATPFGAGIGKARSTCGALSGAVMALGTVVGRTDGNRERKVKAYDHAGRLHDAFVAQAGAEACRDLNEQGFDWPGVRQHCARFVEIAARLAAETILDASSSK
jgi:C_GCAxxG_C_C family probable redox protein